MYKPDPRIVKYLREYDRDLGARWNRDRERWQITWNGKDVWAVVDNNGGYRPLDERVVTEAKLNDLWAHKSGQDFLRMEQEENHRIQGLNKAHEMDRFRQYIVEDGYQEAFGVGQFNGWSPSA